MAAAPGIATRLLILSDTHGARLLPSDAEAARPETAGGDGGGDDDGDGGAPPPAGLRGPLPPADVAIHCGDLTLSASPREFRAAFDLMRAVDAPLKLLVPGNHDIALDRGFCADLLRGQAPGSPRARQVRARHAAAAELVRELRRAGAADGGGGGGGGIHLLDEEGTYHFVLANGARLAVYASPHTPEYGGWAFQYRGAHDFAIPPGADLVVTHGPPRGVLDRARDGSAAGCPHLLAAVARARPRVHCFGHIHEAWGAELVTWRGGGGGGGGGDEPRAAAGGGGAVVDEARSVVLADLATLEGGGGGGGGGDDDDDDRATRRAKRERASALARGRAVPVSLRGGDGGPALQPGRQTLFVNAAVMTVRYRPRQLPWLVDVDLPPPDDEHLRRAEATAARLRELAERPVEPL